MMPTPDGWDKRLMDVLTSRGLHPGRSRRGFVMRGRGATFYFGPWSLVTIYRGARWVLQVRTPGGRVRRLTFGSGEQFACWALRGSDLPEGLL
jgi:hypothetical protein